MAIQHEAEHRSGELPRLSTSFIGREAEIAELLELLADPSRRLVSIVGPGGMGKTRLSIELARRARQHVENVVFVPLQPVQAPDRVLSAIADALGIPIASHERAPAQLAAALRDLDTLLVLDNMEHIAEGAPLVAMLLERAAAARFLVTSRHALNLSGEWRYQLGGLQTSGTSGDALPAVRLFDERARQHRHDFVLERERAAVTRICELVEGAPLAIELAAAWTRLMDAREIAAQIERGIDFLATGMHDMPERHRSIQAVFAESWRLLDEDECHVFKRLAVFRGGFTAVAAREVIGASLPSLLALVDKSLVQREPDGRFALHGLLRQFAEDQLAASPEQREATRAAHCRYYARFCAERRDGLFGARQREALEEVARDLENIVAAWDCAIEHRDWPEVEALLDALDLHSEMRCRYADGLERVSSLARALEAEPPSRELELLLARVSTPRAWFLIRVGRIGEARDVVERIMEIHARYGIERPAGYASCPLAQLGVIALVEGDFAQAEALGREALAITESTGDRHNLQFAHYVLTNALDALGRHDEARAHGLAAYELASGAGDRWFTAYVLNDLGNVLVSLGDHEGARRYFEAGYAIREEYHDPEGMAVALNNLGALASRRGEYEQAAQPYRRAAKIYREIGDRGGLAASLEGLGVVACAIGAPAEAAERYGEALRLATEMNFVPRMLSVLTGIAEMLMRNGRPSAATSIAASVRAHPSSGPLYLRLDEVLAQTRGGTAPAEADLQRVVVAALAELEQVPVSRTTPKPELALAGTLTEREREVLRLVAGGLSNRQIAEQLVVSAGTVKAHTHAIFRKLGAENRVQAIAAAREAGLLPTFEA